MDLLMCVRYDPNSVRQRRALAEMFVDYLMEELERTGSIACGLPVALHLKTFLMVRDEVIVGFYSLDRRSYSIELIYVVPQCRRQRVASQALERLQGAGQRDLQAKTPFSPAGAALMHSAGVGPVALSRKDEEHRAAEFVKDQAAWRRVIALVKGECPHRARRNRSRLCPVCCRKYLSSYVTAMLTPLGAAPVHP